MLVVKILHKLVNFLVASYRPFRMRRLGWEKLTTEYDSLAKEACRATTSLPCAIQQSSDNFPIPSARLPIGFGKQECCCGLHV
jgi:hypothetical protein